MNYNLEIFKYVPPILDTSKIPKVIYTTYKDKNKIPQKVYDNLNRFAPSYELKVFDDNDCVAFLRTHYLSNVVDKFNSLKGTHKADLFRYCILYINGGVYMDIKTELIKPLDDMFPDDKALYTVISKVDNTMYQGIIAVRPRNELFSRLIRFMVCKHSVLASLEYHIFTKDFYRQIDIDTGHKPVAGKTLGKLSDYYLFQEQCSKNPSDCYDGLDRYGFCSYITDNDERIIKMRYSDYPWN